MSSQIELLRDTAKKVTKTIILPEGEETRVIKAAEICLKEKIARIILVGGAEKIKEIAKTSNISLDGVEIVEPSKHPKVGLLIDTFYNLRRHRGITRDEAEKAVLWNYVNFAALLTKIEEVDGFVAGASHATPSVARAAIFCLGVDKEIGVVSSSFLVELDDIHYRRDGLFVFADCGIVPEPTPGQLASIAISSSRLYENLFRKKAITALLSYSTKGSAGGKSVEKVINALKIVKKKSPGLIIDGELQLDAAIVPEVAKIKTSDSPVAGRANVLIFPDLDAGNIGYKLVQRLARARVVGPVIQGVEKPACDLSRGCSVSEIVDGIAVTAVLAQQC